MSCFASKADFAPNSQRAGNNHAGPASSTFTGRGLAHFSRDKLAAPRWSPTIACRIAGKNVPVPLALQEGSVVRGRERLLLFHTLIAFRSANRDRSSTRPPVVKRSTPFTSRQPTMLFTRPARHPSPKFSTIRQTTRYTAKSLTR